MYEDNDCLFFGNGEIDFFSDLTAVHIGLNHSQRIVS